MECISEGEVPTLFLRVVCHQRILVQDEGPVPVSGSVLSDKLSPDSESVYCHPKEVGWSRAESGPGSDGPNEGDEEGGLGRGALSRSDAAPGGGGGQLRLRSNLFYGLLDVQRLLSHLGRLLAQRAAGLPDLLVHAGSLVL